MTTHTDWNLRTIPEQLRERYRSEGLWTDETLAAFLGEHISRNAGLGFHVHSDVRPYHGTLGEVLDLGRRFAGGLRARGVGPGDVVAFQLPNWAEAGAMFYGASLLGVVLVPIVHIYGPQEVAFILRQSGARAFVVPDRFGQLGFVDWVPGVVGDLDALELTVIVGEEVPEGATTFERLLDDGPVEEAADVDPDSPAAIAYTSGTTSEPKGVIHSHRTLLAEIRQLSALQPEMPPQIVGAPVGHVIGMLAGLLMPPYRAESIHLIDAWDPGRVLDLMLEYDLGAGNGATYFLLSLLDHPDFSEEHRKRMPQVGLGGSSVPASVGERADELGISIIRSYGSTEHPSVTGSRHSDPKDKRIRTDGRPMPGVDVELVDLDGGPAEPGQPGEIWSRGPELCLGYTDPALTAEAFTNGGWYRTGDVGVLDEDGFVTITDRISDVIIRGGENVSAAEVEDVVSRMPAVAEVAVVGAPDERYGERACAVLRTAPDSGDVDLEQLREFLAGQGIAKQKWPESVRVVADFPRTPSGKIQKYVLRQQLREGEL